MARNSGGINDIFLAATFHRPLPDFLLAVCLIALVYSVFFEIPPAFGYAVSITCALLGLSAIMRAKQYAIRHIVRFGLYMPRETDTYLSLWGQKVFWRWWGWFLLRGIILLWMAFVLLPVSLDRPHAASVPYVLWEYACAPNSRKASFGCDGGYSQCTYIGLTGGSKRFTAAFGPGMACPFVTMLAAGSAN